MPRPPRPQFPGAIYHVTTRGNRKEAIFTDTRDRLRFLQLLEQIVTSLEWRCHTYCLMSNHYHLLVQTSDADISRGMHRLNGVYAKWFNWRQSYEGHLFERRFRSKVVEGHAQLLELTRYIVLNPVRAGLVPDSGDWRWSSYNAMVGKAPQPAFLTTGWVLSLFSSDPNRARELYADFVSAGAEQHRRLGHDPVPGTRTRPDQPFARRSSPSGSAPSRLRR